MTGGVDPSGGPNRPSDATRDAAASGEMGVAEDDSLVAEMEDEIVSPDGPTPFGKSAQHVAAQSHGNMSHPIAALPLRPVSTAIPYRFRGE